MLPAWGMQREVIAAVATKLADRAELAAFLRTHRSKLSPEQVGLPRGGRRRVHGLKREEVAQLSGVGVTWYTWLEQARNIRVSAHFLERLSKALRLNSAEKKHLFALCRVALPQPPSSKRPKLSESLRRFIDAFPGPAYFMVPQTWDMVYWNIAMAAMFVRPFPPNVMEFMFLDSDNRPSMGDWRSWGRTSVAKFKLDVAPVMNEPEIVKLIDKLKRGSSEFRQWWQEPGVVGRDEHPRTWTHPRVGEMTFTQSTFTVDHAPNLRLRAFTAMDAATIEKTQQLIEHFRAANHPWPPKP